MSLTIDIPVSPCLPFSVSVRSPASVPGSIFTSLDIILFCVRKLVGMRGLEPPRCHHHRLLRPARLPVPPHPRVNGIYEPDRGVSRQPKRRTRGRVDTETRRENPSYARHPRVTRSPRFQCLLFIGHDVETQIPRAIRYRYTGTVSLLMKIAFTCPAGARDTIIEALANFNF
jgi:hypothetical protein